MLFLRYLHGKQQYFTRLENSLQLSTSKLFLALRSWCLPTRKRGPDLSEVCTKRGRKTSTKSKVSPKTNFWPKQSAVRTIIMTNRCGYPRSRKQTLSTWTDNHVASCETVPERNGAIGITDSFQ